MGHLTLALAPPESFLLDEDQGNEVCAGGGEGGFTTSKVPDMCTRDTQGSWLVLMSLFCYKIREVMSNTCLILT